MKPQANPSCAALGSAGATGGIGIATIIFRDRRVVGRRGDGRARQGRLRPARARLPARQPQPVRERARGGNFQSISTFPNYVF